MTYLLLLHIHTLASFDSSIFIEDYKYFFCQVKDPAYIKKIKFQILVTIAQEKNSTPILEEIIEHVKDSNITICQWAIQAISSLAIKGIGLLSTSIQHLLSFLSMEIDSLYPLIISVFYGILLQKKKNRNEFFLICF